MCGSSCLEVFCLKLFLEILQSSQANSCVGVSFLIKLQASILQLYYKRGYITKEAPAKVFFKTPFLYNTFGFTASKCNVTLKKQFSLPKRTSKVKHSLNMVATVNVSSCQNSITGTQPGLFSKQWWIQQNESISL